MTTPAQLIGLGGAPVPAGTGEVGSRGSALRLFVRRPLTLAAVLTLLLMAVLAVAGPAIAPFGDNDIDVNNIMAGPGANHWLGTDELGRDILSRIVIAVHVSLAVSLVSVAISLAVGLALGIVAGYYRRAADTFVMRAMDVLFAFPAMLLAIALVAVLGPGLHSATIAIAVVYTPIFARIARANVLAVCNSGYVAASRAIGSSDWYIIRMGVLPNIAAAIVVQTSLSLGFAILAEAGLSYLGLGVQPPEPSWGGMLFEASGYIGQAWWMGVFPGLAIVMTVLSLNILGDTLRDVLDPRVRAEIEMGRRHRRSRP